MSFEQIKTTIREAVKSFATGNLTEKSIELFEKLGYVTERRAPLHKPTYTEFKDTYLADKKFDESKAKTSEWKYVDLLFQLSKEEVLKQTSLFDTRQVDRTIIETYLFFAIELSGEQYSRTELSLITREVNHLFPMPAMILFRYGKTLTLSVINRRLHKRDETKDVLEKVTLIKDIVINNPHRAHIEILFDLSFDQLKSKHQFTNFVELHNAWQKTLDTKELNKRFYSELFNWYLWAVRSVNFPNDVSDDKDDMTYNSESIIRLLTRLIFVWFIKEKNLVPDSLFELKKLKEILKDFKPQSTETSVYYRAILQNLFFATLNTPMDKDISEENKDEQRRFINTLPKTGNDQYLDQTKYRYQNYFTKPDYSLELFSTIPFLNGGLFECLDFKEGNKEIRFDGFSSTGERRAFVPDKLFFADEFILDLNSEYGTKGRKYKVEGLINILDSYKFTITENTPLEEEIALDPELLGKVFENLLASYNPETKTTARKQTGSFYTPREIVNYMVDESLIAYFKQKLDNTEESESKIRDLFAHTIELPGFSNSETNALIKAISEAKILDPACGSGAFPMGVLHRLVDLLNKLDPDNKKWNELQKQRAIAETAVVFDSGDVSEREIRLNEINKAFDLSMNYPDYARKLFLIENCIYGVDIQQIAIQISKLRFFISLIVDQKVDDNKPNRNILSMPNLETKFVAANTLIGLDKPKQLTLMAGDVERLEKELASIRHKIFFTRKYSAKKELKKKEKEKREELQKALEESGYTKNVAGQMAGWNPFDPIQSAKFFDPVTMFGFKDGFDVVIGNPPYVRADNPNIAELRKQIMDSKKYVTLWEKWDLYVAFIEKGFGLLGKNGKLSFIIPDAYMASKYSEKSHSYFIENATIDRINFCSEVKIFEAAVKNIIIQYSKNVNEKNIPLRMLHIDTFENAIILDSSSQIEAGERTFKLNQNSSFLNDLSKTTNWEEICYVSVGMVLQSDELHYKGEFKKEDLISYVKDKTHLKEYVEAKWIKRFETKNIKYLEWNTDRVPKKLRRPTFPELYLPKKIIMGGMTGAIFDDTGLLCNHSCSVSVLWKDLSGLNNLSINNSVRKDFNVKGDKQAVVKFRKLLETTSGNYSLKYLLAILNSKFGYYFLHTKRRSQMGFYPDDLKQLPIKNITNINQQPLITLVDQILSVKAENPKADTSQLEKQIDEMVYKLYELTDEEIAIIESK